MDDVTKAVATVLGVAGTAVLTEAAKLTVAETYDRLKQKILALVGRDHPATEALAQLEATPTRPAADALSAALTAYGLTHDAELLALSRQLLAAGFVGDRYEIQATNVGAVGPGSSAVFNQQGS